MGPLGLLLLALLLIAAQAVFVAAEFSLVTVDRAAVERDALAGDRSAKGILAGLRTLSTQLSGAQVGITITSLIVGFLAEPTVAELLRGPLESLGWPTSTALAVSLAAALILATAAQMVFGELIPKNAAIADPRRVAALVTPAQRVFSTAVGPLIWLTNGNANWLLRRMGVEPVEELASARSPQELISLVRYSSQSGTLPVTTADLIDRTLRFGDRQAEDVMTPRTQVEMIDADASVAQALQRSRETGRSRFPVMGTEGPDDIVGVMALRDALRVPEARRDQIECRDVMSSVSRIPEALPLDDVLPRVRGGDHLLLVVDEYGGTAGILTLEDLVEELVGEVTDEYDIPTLRGRPYQDGSWLLSGLLRPEEARELGVPVPDHPDYETVAGLVVRRLGRLSQVGDAVDVAGWRLTVSSLDGHRIDTLTATPLGAP